MEPFVLDPRLEAESFALGELPLSRALLFDDARFPWVVLVPRRTGAAELVDLSRADRVQLLDEIATAMEVLRTACAPDKLNVAALGNVVRQLHVHVVARYERDASWPAPVWGRGERRPYEPGAKKALVETLRRGFGFR